MIINILHEGRIPMLNLEGPVFGYDIAEGSYALFVKMYPSIEIEIPRSIADIEASKKRWAETHAPKEKAVFLHEIPGDVEEEVEAAAAGAYAEGLIDANEFADTIGKPAPLTDDDVLIDLAIEEAKDAAPRVIPQTVKVVLGGKYDGRQIDSLVKRECKEILEERGFASATEKFGKSDPKAWKYRDSVEDLRRKVKETQ